MDELSLSSPVPTCSEVIAEWPGAPPDIGSLHSCQQKSTQSAPNGKQRLHFPFPECSLLLGLAPSRKSCLYYFRKIDGFFFSGPSRNPTDGLRFSHCLQGGIWDIVLMILSTVGHFNQYVLLQQMFFESPLVCKVLGPGRCIKMCWWHMCYVLGHMGANKIVGEILWHSGGLGPQTRLHACHSTTCAHLWNIFI